MGRSTQTHPGHAERLPMSHMLPFSHQLNEAVSSPSSEMMSQLLLQQPGDDLTDSAGHRPMTLAMTWSKRLYQQSNRSFILCVFSPCFNQQAQHLKSTGRGLMLACFGCRYSCCNQSWTQSESKIYKTAQEDTAGQEENSEWRKRRQFFWSFDLVMTNTVCLGMYNTLQTHLENSLN